MIILIICSYLVSFFIFLFLSFLFLVELVVGEKKFEFLILQSELDFRFESNTYVYNYLDHFLNLDHFFVNSIY